MAAFRATLEEVAGADLILHVHDAGHPDTAAQDEDVRAVLDRMAQDETLDEDWRRRTLEVLNKADLLGGVANVLQADAIAVSALTGEGLDSLRAAIDGRLAGQLVTLEVGVPVTDGARLAWLYQHGEVLERRDDESEIRLSVRLSAADQARYERL